MGFGPEFRGGGGGGGVFGFGCVVEGDGLDGGPAEEGVVADEGRDVAVGDGVADRGVDEVGEEGDAVFEVGVHHLHDSGGELEDPDPGAALHFRGGVQEAVGRHAGVAVYDEDVVAYSNVAVGPGARVGHKDFFEACIVGQIFVILGPCGSVGDDREFVLDCTGEREAVVHVGGLFEFAAAEEAFGIVFRARSPADGVVGVKVYPGLSFFFRDDLETVVVYEHVG